MASSEYRSPNHDSAPNDQNIVFSSLLENLHNYSPKTLAILLQSTTTLDTTGLYPAPPLDPTQPPSVPFEYPQATSHHGAEGDSLAYIIAHHFDYNFPVDTTSPTTPNAPVSGSSGSNKNGPRSSGSNKNGSTSPQDGPDNQVEDLQRSLDSAIAFFHARKIPFLRVLEAAGCPNWKQLAGHLCAIAWTQLTVEQLRPRSPVFWHRKLDRLYCEYTQKGIVFEKVPIRLQTKTKIVDAVTRLDDKAFTEGLVTFLIGDIPSQLISRLVVASKNIVTDRLQIHSFGDGLDWARRGVIWRGGNEGYRIFHTYESIPGFAKERPLYFTNSYPDIFLRWAFLSYNTNDFFGVFKEVEGPDKLSYLEPFRQLDMSLVNFGCSVFLTSLDFLANRFDRRADTIWKNLTVLNMSNISDYFRKVIVNLEDVPDDVAMDARERLTQLAALDLTRI